MRVFSREWFVQYQPLLLWLLNAPLTRRWFRWVLCIRSGDVGYDRDILRLAPNHYVVFGGLERNGRVRLIADFRTHDKYAKRLYHAFRPLWWTLHAIDAVGFDWWAPQYGFGFLTLTQYPDSGNPGAVSVDCEVGRHNVDQTWAALTAGAGTYAVSNSGITISIVGSTTSNQFAEMARGITHFDTSGLGSGATINSATCSLRGFGKQDNLVATPTTNLYASTVVSNTTVASADFQSVASTPFSDTPISYASWSISAYNDLVLNAAGLAAISKAGVTKFSVRSNYDVTVTDPPWVSGATSRVQFRAAEQGGADQSQDPKLVVDYTASATDLSVSSIGEPMIAGSTF